MKLQLISLKAEGYIKYEGLLPTPEEELALLIDEPVHNVRLLITTLLKTGSIEQYEDQSLYLLAVQNLIGSEGSSAERVRRFRENKKLELLQCNTDVTQSIGEYSSEQIPLQSNTNVTPLLLEAPICPDELQSNVDVTILLRRERDRTREDKRRNKYR